MNKKGKNIEIKIYELLGVKIFRKMAFGLYKVLGLPITIFMSKENRKEFYKTPNNYNMKKGNGLQDLRDFKKMLLFNASIHIVGLVLCLPTFLRVVSGVASTATVINNLTAIGINLYCIMLQRYNHIRINEVLKKGEAREQKQKDVICEELKQENNFSNDLTHKIVNKNEKEVVITLEEFLQTATLQQLKDYKRVLEYIEIHYEYLQEIDGYSQLDMKFPLEKGKSLKLELKLNKNNKSAN